MDAPRTTKDRAKNLRRQMSLPEVLLWKAIKGRRLQRLHFRKQHPLGPYVLDFYCDAEKLAVEVDGSSHSFGERPARDERRDALLKAQGITTLRLSAVIVLSDMDAALRTILGHLEFRPAPSGPPQWASTPSVSALRTDPPPPQSGYALGEDLGAIRSSPSAKRD